MPTISALMSLKQENGELKASLGYLARFCPNYNNSNNSIHRTRRATAKTIFKTLDLPNWVLDGSSCLCNFQFLIFT